MKYTNAEIKDSLQRVIKFLKINKKNPNYIGVKNDKLTVKEYNNLPTMQDAINRINKWIKNNNDYPNYVTILDIKMDKKEYSILFKGKLTSVSTSTKKTTVNKTRFVSSPYLLSSSWVKQDYDTSCALNSIQQSIYKLTGLKISESTMYKLGYTGSNGTGHDGINNIIKWFNKQYHHDLKVSWKNLSDFGSSSKEKWTNIGKMMSRADTAIFMHIGYTNGGKSCSSGDNWHGHYEVFDVVNVGTMYIRALNSLSGGYLQDRKISVEECYMKRISQPSICIIQK